MADTPLTTRRAMLRAIPALTVTATAALSASAEAAPKVEMSDEAFAAIDFKAWVHEDGEFVPPTNEEWCRAVNPTLIAIRMAWMVMYKTKPELIEMLRGMDKETLEDGENLAIDFAERLSDAEARIGQLHEVLRGAFARVAVAAYNA